MALRIDQPIVVSAVVLRDERGRLLMVRKAGTSRFMLPGGKPEPGESAVEAAVREVAEELGLRLEPAELVSMGTFEAAAANEDGELVRASVFVGPTLTDQPVAAAEIDELRWLNPADAVGEGRPTDLAPLLIDHVLAALDISVAGKRSSRRTP